jgi:hypothetical protein
VYLGREDDLIPTIVNCQALPCDSDEMVIMEKVNKHEEKFNEREEKSGYLKELA